MSEHGKRSGTGSAAGSREGGKAFDSNVCAFSVGERAFALDVALVGEVVTVESFVPVPLSPPAVRGLFNLRGVPVALVDLSALLDTQSVTANDESRVALVVKTDEMTVGLAVDRLVGVISSGSAAFLTSDAPDEHPMVQGFLEVAGPAETVITVLEPRAVIERLEAMKFLTRD